MKTEDENKESLFFSPLSRQKHKSAMPIRNCISSCLKPCRGSSKDAPDPNGYARQFVTPTHAAVAYEAASCRPRLVPLAATRCQLWQSFNVSERQIWTAKSSAAARRTLHRSTHAFPPCVKTQLRNIALPRRRRRDRKRPAQLVAEVGQCPDVLGSGVAGLSADQQRCRLEASNRDTAERVVDVGQPHLA